MGDSWQLGRNLGVAVDGHETRPWRRRGGGELWFYGGARAAGRDGGKFCSRLINQISAHKTGM